MHGIGQNPTDGVSSLRQLWASLTDREDLRKLPNSLRWKRHTLEDKEESVEDGRMDAEENLFAITADAGLPWSLVRDEESRNAPMVRHILKWNLGSLCYPSP